MSITRIARSASDEPRMRKLLKDSWGGGCQHENKPRAVPASDGNFHSQT